MFPGETACFSCLPPLALADQNEANIKREGVCAASSDHNGNRCWVSVPYNFEVPAGVWRNHELFATQCKNWVLYKRNDDSESRMQWQELREKANWKEKWEKNDADLLLERLESARKRKKKKKEPIANEWASRSSKSPSLFQKKSPKLSHQSQPQKKTYWRKARNKRVHGRPYGSVDEI